jgi:SAM-dependent methyltransferase
MTQDLNATRAMWDERYGAQPFAYGTEPNVYFAEKLSALPPGRLLLPAEGEARNAAFALRQGWTVDACDLSSEAQRKALVLCAGYEDALDYRVGDAMAMDYADESVDALAFVYAHFPSAVRAELYPKLLRAVRPGGHVIVEVFGQRQLTYQPHHASGGPRDPDQLFTVDDLRQLFEGCDVLELLEGEIQLREGIYHQGQGWVCRFFGIKR